MWPFTTTKKSAGATPLTSLDRSHMQLMDHERRLNELEYSFIQLCDVIKEQVSRIDENTKALDRNMHELAALTLKPPKDLLNGGSQEQN